MRFLIVLLCLGSFSCAGMPRVLVRDCTVLIESQDKKKQVEDCELIAEE